MPKLLDFIKEKGYSHEDVIKFLEERENSEEPDEEEPEEELEEEEVDTVEEEESTEIEDNTDDQKIIQLSELDLNKLITKAIKDSKKAKRKAPSKGKSKGTGTPTNRIYTREEQFEVMF